MSRARRKVLIGVTALLMSLVLVVQPADAAVHCSDWVGGCGAVTGSGMTYRNVKYRNTQSGPSILRWAVAVDVKSCNTGTWYQGTSYTQSSSWQYRVISTSFPICGTRLRSTKGRTLWIGS